MGRTWAIAALLVTFFSLATPSAGATIAGPSWGASAQSPCDPLDTSLCMLPFPNDFYTVPDSAMPTGRRVSFPPGAFPATAQGQTIDPTAWEGNDGFSPGSTILTHVPGFSLSASSVATISDMGASLSSRSPIVLIDATTGQRWPTWAELDVTDADPATQLLMIHPARNLAEGHRYLVALRDLRRADGSSIAPGTAFASVLRSSASASASAPAPASGLSAAYAAHLREVVDELADHGVGSNGLFLAWDFTVASARNLTEPALTMRDQTFAALDGHVGPFRVTKVVDDPPSEPDLARVVTGTFSVPSYLTGPPGSSGSVLTEGPDGLPVHRPGNIDNANFECAVPKAASATRPASIGVYGHGLFGSADEVTASAVPQFSNTYDYTFCGTDWLGLSSGTIALALGVTSDYGQFPTLADNLLQSLLNAQVLGNLMVNPKGFADASAFQNASHHPLIRTGPGRVYYGNSEGGIMGGAFTALSTEARRSVLGVPGMDYAVLLVRSADYTPFQSLVNQSYPDKAVQQLGYDVIQMLWDRAEADGYAEQMTGGLPGTPAHQVLLEEAFGDHQVANVATETEARTIGARLHEPALSGGRSLETQPFWDIPALAQPSSGPALFVWDTGVPAAPLSDTPPTAGPDPHDTTPRTFPSFWAQMHTFFTTGYVSDACGAKPCTG
ncbi:MAG TPA: hypothetical protein VIX84_23450, partial [Acidimicrobiales bacterium]